MGGGGGKDDLLFLKNCGRGTDPQKGEKTWSAAKVGGPPLRQEDMPGLFGR